MRLHISLDDSIVAELDKRVGKRRRSAFIAGSVQAALDDARRWEGIEAGLGVIDASGHDWDADPAEWVAAQRRTDASRVG